MSYLVRVELHNASVTNYETLHRAMAARGFSRTLRGSDGSLYQLPTAEYVIDTMLAGNEVRTHASTAAASTGCTHGVLVVRYDWAWWSGLSLTKAA
jgi:hypothetical protein